MFGFSSTLEVHIESTNIDVFTVVHGEMSDYLFCIVSYQKAVAEEGRKFTFRCSSIRN